MADEAPAVPAPAPGPDLDPPAKPKPLVLPWNVTTDSVVQALLQQQPAYDAAKAQQGQESSAFSFLPGAPPVTPEDAASAFARVSSPQSAAPAAYNLRKEVPARAAAQPLTFTPPPMFKLPLIPEITKPVLEHHPSIQAGKVKIKEAMQGVSQGRATTHRAR